MLSGGSKSLECQWAEGGRTGGEDKEQLFLTVSTMTYWFGVEPLAL